MKMQIAAPTSKNSIICIFLLSSFICSKQSELTGEPPTSSSQSSSNASYDIVVVVVKRSSSEDVHDGNSTTESLSSRWEDGFEKSGRHSIISSAIRRMAGPTDAFSHRDAEKRRRRRPKVNSRPNRSSSKYITIKKTVKKAVLLGNDLYLPCFMKEPIGWLKGDYIIYMDNIMMYDSSTYGAEKFKLDANPSYTRYSLVIRSVQFSDAGSYFCQNGAGEKSKVAITVIENPICLRGKTKLREGEVATYSCLMRLKGDDAKDAQIHWNKEEKIINDLQRQKKNSADGLIIVTSELKYRARYDDNHESVNCFISSPSWNETSSPVPSCSVGVLDIAFEPRLLCDQLQIFPDLPRGNFYIYCDVIANPINDLDSILWFLLVNGGQEKRIEDFENMTRKDISIPNGYRSKILIPYNYLKAKGNRLEFIIKMYYSGNLFSKTIKVVMHSPLPSTFVALSVATASFIFIALILLFLYFHFHQNRSKEGDSIQCQNDDKDENSLPQLNDDTVRGVGTGLAENGSRLHDNGGGNNLPLSGDDLADNKDQLNLMPTLKDSDEPNNQRPQLEWQTKRKVRFKTNI